MSAAKLNIIIIILMTFMFFEGCKSKILIDNLNPESIPSLYGKNTERDFVSKAALSDSLALVWQVSLVGGFQNTGLSIKDNYAFVNDLSGRVACIDLDKGNIHGQIKASGSVLNTPVIYRNFLIFIENTSENEKSYLSVYNLLTGEYSLHKEFTGKVMSEILLEEDNIYFVTNQGTAYKFKTNGDLIWKYESKQFVHSSPALSKGIMVFGTDAGNVIGLDVKSGLQIYNVGLSKKAFESGFVIKNNIVYACSNDGVLYAVDLAGGALKFKVNMENRVIAFPVVSDCIYVATLKGEIYCITLEGQVKWHIKTGGLFNAAPILVNTKLIVPDLNKKVLFVDAVTGKIVKTLSLEGKTRLSPALYKNLLLIGYERGIVEAYEFIY